MDDLVIDERRVSTDVRLRMHVGDLTLDLAQIGPGSVILREGVDLPRSQAEIIMTVDGKERRWSVLLPWGAMRDDTDVLTEGVESSS